MTSFTSGPDVDPALRTAARVLPRGYALNRGLAVQRAALTLLGRIRAGRDVPVVAVDADVSVRLHRPARLADPAPALLWIHGGGFVMGSARQEDGFCRRLSHLANVAVAAVDNDYIVHAARECAFAGVQLGDHSAGLRVDETRPGAQIALLIDADDGAIRGLPRLRIDDCLEFHVKNSLSACNEWSYCLVPKRQIVY